MTPETTERYIEFREPRTIVELEEMLKLRYSVRRSCHLAALCPENEAQIDLDEHDRNAYHLGLFMIEGHRFVPVGYSRFVLDYSGPQERWVEVIAKKNGLGHKLADPRVPFPCLKYMPFKYGKLVSELHTTATAQGKVMGESCGTVLRKDIRSIRTANRWVESIVAYLMIYKGISCGTTVVSEHHAPFYYRFGFKPLAGIPVPWGSPHGISGAHICLEHLPENTPTVNRVYDAAHEFARSGKIVVSGQRHIRTILTESMHNERIGVCTHA